jgi:hypothetical protein
MTALGPTNLWSIKDQVVMIGNPENAVIHTPMDRGPAKKDMQEDQTGKCSRQPS